MTRKFNSILFVISLVLLSTSCDKDDSAPIETSNIIVSTPPLKLDYLNDEPLNLSGLVITQTMTDGSSEEVPFSEFENRGIVSTPSDGTVLTELIPRVIITHTASSKSTNFILTVKEGISSAEDIYEQNDTCETATQIDTCISLTATINSTNDIDYYYFSATAGQNIEVQILNIPSNFLLKRSFYDKNKNFLFSATQVIQGEEVNATLLVNEDTEYYMRIETVNNEYSVQPYMLNINNSSCN